MQKHEIEMWETNIENTASKVVTEYGSAVVNSVFAKYDATGLHNLAPNITVRFSLISN